MVHATVRTTNSSQDISMISLEKTAEQALLILRVRLQAGANNDAELVAQITKQVMAQLGLK